MITHDFKKEDAPVLAEHIPDYDIDADDESQQPAVRVEEDLSAGISDPIIFELMDAYGLDDEQAFDVRTMIVRWGIDEEEAVERVRNASRL